jgi:hypothetical protein
MPTHRQLLLAVLSIIKWAILVISPWFVLLGFGAAAAGSKTGNATQEYVGYAIAAVAAALGAVALLALARDWNKSR